MSRTEPSPEGNASETRLPLRVETRDEILRPLLRGGETWDSLLRKMAEQYNPDEDPENHGYF